MVKIRLQRLGSTHKPFYRVVVAESSRARDGKFLEVIGTYNPLKDEFNVDRESLDKWVKNGAQPTDTVKSLLRKNK